MDDPESIQLSAAERLVDDYLRRRDAGEAVDLESICNANPELANEIRSLVANFDVLDRLLPGPPQDGGETAISRAFELVARLRSNDSRGARFRRDGELGRGGMGVVLKVHDPELRRDLAMKVMHGDRGGTSVGDLAVESINLGRFVEEAQITAQLDHPGIVPLHEIGVDDDGAVYYTMPLIDGEDLLTVFDHVQNGASEWSQVRALNVMLKVCDAMSYAHAKQVLHRDLKPSNVMVGRFGQVYVVDWGLARVIGEPDVHDIRICKDAPILEGLVATERVADRQSGMESPLVTMDGDVLGTAAYMSPEQARGEIERLGPQSDVYSVGAMLYHLLSGHPPFKSPSGATPGSNDEGTVLERVKRAPPPRLDAVAPDAAPELVAICEKAMARKASDRYADMQDLADDLRRYVERRVVRAYETGGWAETRKWVRRNKAFAASLAASIAIVATGSLTLWSTAQETRRNQPFVTSRDLARFLAESSDLTPARRSDETTTAWWFRRARGFVRGTRASGAEEESGPGLEDCRSELSELRGRAVPIPDAEREHDEELLDLRRMYETKRADLEWRRRMLEPSRFPPESVVEAEISFATLPSDPVDLQLKAFDLIAPNKRRLFQGQEVRALCIARRAAATATGDVPRLRTLDTLAWALCRVAHFEEARQNALEALAAAERNLESSTGAGRDEADHWVRNIKDNAQNIMRETACWTLGEEARLLPRREAELLDLAERIRTWNGWSISHAIEGRRYEVLDRLVTDLERLRRRIELAAEATETDAARRAWAQATQAVEAEPLYAGMPRLTPQLDLVPLGRDPDSRLLEFGHPPSGLPPQRVDGHLQLTRNSSLVFVLLPGTRTPFAPGTGTVPRTPAPIEPFFISKYEMTEAQWARLTGRSELDMPEDLALHPLGALDWFEASALLRETGAWLRLPTDVEWTYAAQGGGAARFWCGKAARSLAGFANLNFDALPQPRTSPRFVGEKGANPFGLHDVYGNVQEWCSDTVLEPEYRTGRSTERRSRIVHTCEVAGGTAAQSPEDLDAQVFRFVYSRARDDYTGIRPARRLTP